VTESVFEGPFDDEIRRSAALFARTRAASPYVVPVRHGLVVARLDPVRHGRCGSARGRAAAQRRGPVTQPGDQSGADGQLTDAVL
jgi:hypothetical protein